jgi:hypothetical protein
MHPPSLLRFALDTDVDYDSVCAMTHPVDLRCDGCGQAASPEHVAKRLQRLELATRYRPVHIGTLLLGAIMPSLDGHFLYGNDGSFGGEAGLLLQAVGVRVDSGKAADAVLAEFQRGGFFLAHVLECPLEEDANTTAPARARLDSRVAGVAARMRRSLKPKRVALISRLLDPFIGRLQAGDLGCPLVLDNGKAFALDGDRPAEALARLAEALRIPAGAPG